MVTSNLFASTNNAASYRGSDEKGNGFLRSVTTHSETHGGTKSSASLSFKKAYQQRQTLQLTLYETNFQVSVSGRPTIVNFRITSLHSADQPCCTVQLLNENAGVSGIPAAKEHSRGRLHPRRLNNVFEREYDPLIESGRPSSKQQ